MKILNNQYTILFLSCFLLAYSPVSAQAQKLHPKKILWKPVVDDIYLQEVGIKVKTDDPLLSLVRFDGELLATTGKQLLKLDQDQLVPAGDVKVKTLQVVNGELWGISNDELLKLSNGSWEKIADIKAAGLCLHNGKIIVAARKEIYELSGKELRKLTKDTARLPIREICSHNETLYVRHDKGLCIFLDGEFIYHDVQDWGTPPLGSKTMDLLSLGNQLIVSTNKGLGILRGMSWYHINGEKGLCYEDTTCLAEGFDHDYWVGTSKGAIRVVDGEFHFFGHERWIPHDKVNDIVCGKNITYIATDAGLGIIQYEPFTLQKKAAWYDRWLEEYGHKRLGFVHRLFWDSKTKEYIRFISDNDVGWTGSYLNALCYQYAVTGDEEVRKEAVNVFKTMKWSEEITPIKGYPARAINAVGDSSYMSTTGSGGLPAEWNRTKDNLWDWKSDTSSDEIDVHISSTALFLELVAKGKEAEAAKEHLDRVVGHIIDNGWVLRDLDGKPTRWGRWDPEYLQRPYGFLARGLNGMEAMAYSTTAFHFTKNPKFKEGKQQLLDWEYQKTTLRQKEVFPHATHFDDRLAFLAYLPLLQYETDPSLRSIVTRSLDRAWEVKRIDNVAWFNFVYGSLTGNDCEVPQAVKHLRTWPLSCFDYRYTNSHRSDLKVPEGYKNYIHDWKPLTPREYGIHWLDFNYQALDGGGSNSINDPSAFLESYWMGRYFGFIQAPETDQKELLTVKKRNLQLGARPYEGHPRPKLKNPF